ncbi:macrolide family glycosyltransferase [Saccharopolyspora cebuensis]|uniref:Macrolide family glycosyltransferase n=1 Tax=Saccharopolyspora cebuensis TaxID=418759 RepID=A0ABV4CQE2_9PSEU
MHFVFASVPATGHVNPTLPVVAELVRAGHRVTYGTGEQWRGAVEAAGATLLPLATHLPGPPPTTGSAPDPALFREALDTMIAGAREDFGTLEALLRRDPAEALCYDTMTEAGRMAAERTGTRSIALHPSHASNEEFKLLERISPGGADHPALGLLGALQAQLAGLAAECGVSAPDLGRPAEHNVVFLPREFQYEGATFDERFRFVGPSLGARGEDTSWWPAGDGPVLFISLGTAFNARPDFFRLCLEAFGNTRWQVAMAIGEHVTAEDLGPVPDNVEIRPYFPQPAVLRRATVFLSHTGMGSTMESLHFGVPLVAVPQMPEQAANARRVVELGLGVELPATGLDAAVLRDTVDEVAADPAIGARTAAMRDVVRATGGPPAAAEAIERFARAPEPTGPVATPG